MRSHWRPVIAASTGNACARSANAAYESNGSELVLGFHGACSTAITAYDSTTTQTAGTAYKAAIDVQGRMYDTGMVRSGDKCRAACTARHALWPTA